VGAALLTAVLLGRGEDWCWSLLRLLSRPLRMLAAVDALPVSPPRRLPVPPVIDAPSLLLLANSQSRRGPPCVAG
jgi:hypothetical protein